jgi:hypothetical protein
VLHRRHFFADTSRRHRGLVLNCRVNNWRRLPPGLDVQKIGEATELQQGRRLPSSDEEW